MVVMVVVMVVMVLVMEHPILVGGWVVGLICLLLVSVCSVFKSGLSQRKLQFVEGS